MKDTETDIKVRKALAWNACHKLRKIWKSQRQLTSTVESVLLYGSDTWTLTKSFIKQINGCYTRMLRMTYDISWKERLTNKSLYGKLPLVSTKIQVKRMRLAGHCLRHTEEIANKLVLWNPTDGKPNRGRKHISYIDNLLNDTGVNNEKELMTIMNNRVDWKNRVFELERPERRQK